MKRALFSMLFFAGPALAASVTYRVSVTLLRTLSKRTFPEQPNYESVAKGDRPATYFFVSPPTVFCVAMGNSADNEPAEPRIAGVQLVFSLKEDGYSPLRPYLNKQVECHGTLFH